MTSITKPPFGRRLLPQLLDEFSQATPARIFATISTSTSLPSTTFRDVTFSEVANSVNFYADWLEKHFGRGVGFETVCYIGISDLRYAICFLGAIKCGYKTLFVSTRNPLATNLLLLEKTECSKLCYSTEFAGLSKCIQDVRTMQSFGIPTMEEMICTVSDYYPYNETFEDVFSNPIVVFHSSGTTGPPKPIIMSHGCLATLDNDHNLAEIAGRRKHDFTIWNFIGGAKFYSAFPPVHLAGFISTAVIPIYTEAAIPVLGPALKPPSASVLRDIMKDPSQNLRAMFMPPSIAEHILQDTAGISLFDGIDFVCYAGGQLSKSAGDQLSQITNLCQYYGSTETFQIQQLVPQPEDWAYMEWHPRCPVEMKAHDIEKRLYELVIHPNPSTAVHHIYPDVEKYRTNDIFERHPSKPTLWKFFGRVDDILVMSNGQKLNPIPMEALLQDEKEIAAAVVIGQGRSQAALLIEPRDQSDPQQLKGLVDKIWPAVQEVNNKSPTYGRIMRSKIIIGSKAFPRSAKGTILRQQAIALYQKEIDSIYKDNSTTMNLSDSVLDFESNLERIKSFVKANLDSLLPSTNISLDDDLFAAGLDSLKAIELLQNLQCNVTLKTSNISIDIIWSNPTIGALSQALYDSIHTMGTKIESVKFSSVAKITAMMEKYTSDLTLAKQIRPVPLKGALQVLLTGSTGAIGVRVLQNLLDDHRVSKVYCLDRSADARTRVLRMFRGNPHDAAKIEFLQVDLCKQNFNLTLAKYTELAEKVDITIHSAWRVDFNLILDSFDPLVRGVRALIDFSIATERRPRLVFFSSIASAQNFNDANKPGVPIPESIIESEETATGLGYGESKYVSERILAAASERCSLPVLILRVGQIAGPISGPGVWPLQEWVPSLIQTSKTLSILPLADFKIDWIPIDILAQSVLEISLNQEQHVGSTVYNLVNPASIGWNSFIKTIQNDLSGEHVKLVTFAEWVRHLELHDNGDLSNRLYMPALKMLNFFRGLRSGSAVQQFETARVIRASRSVALLGPIREEWIRVWIRQLHEAGGLL